MIILNILGLAISLYILVKSSDYAIRYSANLAKLFQISSFMVSFIIVSIISVLPEAAVAVMSSLKGTPNLGLGTLLGSNVTDLSLVFGLIAIFSGTGIKVK